jgi:hypothetical protein
VEQIRYLIRFSDGGVGMRHRREPLEVGKIIEDGGESYVIEAVEPPPSPTGFGRASARRSDHHGQPISRV